MGEKMSLEQVRDGLIGDSKYFITASGKTMVQARQMKIYADAIESHLATPAQTVDIEVRCKAFAFDALVAAGHVSIARSAMSLAIAENTLKMCTKAADKLAKAIGERKNANF